MEFREIALADRAEVDRIRALAGHKASSHAFVSLYLWRHSMGLRIALGENAFCVKGTDGYFFPCGDEKEVKAFCLALVKEEPRAVFSYLREEDLPLAKALLDKTHTPVRTPSFREYLYNRSEQLEMKGKRFTYQRAKVNKARRLGVMESCLLDRNLLSAARELTLSWAARRGEDKGDLGETLEALAHFDALSLFGNMLFCNKEPVGFNLGSFLSEDTFAIHIAKTLVDDVDTLMKWELYKALPDRVTTINREEDLGLYGLAVHKQDAQPCGFQEMYCLTAR